MNLTLTTERSKVEAFYAHLGWNLLVFQTLYSKITLVHLVSNSENDLCIITNMAGVIYFKGPLVKPNFWSPLRKAFRKGIHDN